MALRQAASDPMATMGEYRPTSSATPATAGSAVRHSAHKAVAENTATNARLASGSGLSTKLPAPIMPVTRVARVIDWPGVASTKQTTTMPAQSVASKAACQVAWCSARGDAVSRGRRPCRCQLTSVSPQKPISTHSQIHSPGGTCGL